MAQDKELKVNINYGSREALISIKGLGPSLAQRIIEGRPYGQLSDLVRVSGINEIKLASLLPFLTIENAPKDAPKMEKPEETAINLPTKASGAPMHGESIYCPWKNPDQRAAILIILSGFFFGLMILLIRRKRK